MAERRMFSKSIIDSDAFLDMPQSSQLLYFHLCMRADDDGFIDNPKSIMRNVGCKEDDMKVLIAKQFIFPFESGVVVIRHWLIHNYIQKDRYKETKYLSEKSTLSTDTNKAYILTENSLDTECIQPVSKMDTQVSIELGKYSIELNNSLSNNNINNKLSSACARAREEELIQVFTDNFKDYFHYWGFDNEDKQTFNEVIQVLSQAVIKARAGELKYYQMAIPADELIRLIEKLDVQDIRDIVWQVLNNQEIKDRYRYILGAILTRAREK